MARKVPANSRQRSRRDRVKSSVSASARVAVDIDKLSIAERIQLAEDLWDSIPANNDEMELTAAQRAELDRRLDDLKRNPEAGEPWDVVMARIQERLKRGG